MAGAGEADGLQASAKERLTDIIRAVWLRCCGRGTRGDEVFCRECRTERVCWTGQLYDARDAPKVLCAR